jgi:peptide/nickel transport system permease protein
LRALERLRGVLAAPSAVVLVLVVLAASGAPWIAGHDPYTPAMSERLTSPQLVWPGKGHLLGTDQLGRDIWARLIYGARVSLLVGVVSALGAGLIGVLLGLLAGYCRGVSDNVIVGLADIQQSFPFFALAIALVATLGAGLENVLIVLCITNWVTFGRVIRNEVLAIVEHEYVEAARALGLSPMRILFRHVLPGIRASALTIASLVFSSAIVSEASLTFLGIGIPSSIVTWGGMLGDSRNYMRVAWWMMTFPGLALTLTVLAVNTLGDRLRERLDPGVVRSA